MSMPTGGGNTALPLTGTALVIGGTAVPAPTLAAIAAALVIGGFLILRFVRPQKVTGVLPGRPGRAKTRIWRRGSI